MIRAALAAAALFAPAGAFALALSCPVPARIERPRPDLPDARQPRRVLPIGSYTLALTWSPRFCRDARNKTGLQCGQGRFGFTLHGLWPDGEGRQWPQYCRPVALLPESVIRRNLCATPSVQLLQHEYAKHGSCMGVSPAQYFGQATALYRRLRYPDMAALSRQQGLTAGRFAAAFARANPGIAPDMMRITADRRGWLDEVWLCMNRQLRYARCPAHQGGLAASAPVKIWRGGR